MCFSAEVDLVAGLAITAIGVDAVRHAAPRTELPLAVLPVLFGIHLNTTGPRSQESAG